MPRPPRPALKIRSILPCFRGGWRLVDLDQTKEGRFYPAIEVDYAKCTSTSRKTRSILPCFRGIAPDLSKYLKSVQGLGALHELFKLFYYKKTRN